MVTVLSSCWAILRAIDSVLIRIEQTRQHGRALKVVLQIIFHAITQDVD